MDPLVIVTEEDNADGIRHLRYAASLVRRHRRAGLTMAGIVREAPWELGIVDGSLPELGAVVIPDPDSKWSGLLRVAHHPFAFFLVDPQGVIDFAALRIRNEVIRQLVERRLYGKVDFSPPPGVQGFPLERGALRRLEVVHYLSGERRALRELKPDWVVFFSPECARCDLERYLEAYAHFQEASRERAEEVTAVFGPSFLPSDFARTSLAPEVLNSIYLSAVRFNEEASDGDIFDSRWGFDVAMVRVDAGGDPVSVQSLEDWEPEN